MQGPLMRPDFGSPMHGGGWSKDKKAEELTREMAHVMQVAGSRLLP